MTARQSMRSGRGFAVSVVALAAVLSMAGCSSMGGAINTAMGKPAMPNAQPAPAQQTQTATPQTSAQAQPQASGSPSVAYQYQFGAFYTGMWSMGWFGYADANYQPGQGTVWTFAGSGGSSSKPLNFERALLEVNADSSQWWRFKLETDKRTIVYEFLVGPDATLLKVRYRDPDNGAIGEFVPGPTQQQPGQGQPNMPRSRADMAAYLVGSQPVQVKGGSFTADHYLYSDANGSAEMWLSDKVPGYMIKSVFTSKKDNKTATGELVQIESGVTTALSSY